MIGLRRRRQRFLATILFTDIAGSTDLAAKIGDEQWRHLTAKHNAMVRRWLRRYGGHEIDTAGDGFLAWFEQPAEAIRAADAIVAEAAGLGLSVRAGVHTGECEVIGRKVGGIAVHIAARVVALADGGQIVVSGTVHDVVAGSDLQFTERGVHSLKGVPGEWHIFSLVRDARKPATIDAGAEVAATSESEGSRRQRRLVALAGGAGIVAALSVIVAGAFATGLIGGPARPMVEAGPDTVVPLDRSGGNVLSNEVRRVGSGPVAIGIRDGTAWVAALDAGVVNSFALNEPGAEHTTGRVGQPTDLACGDPFIWVSDAFGQSLALVVAQDASVDRTIEGVLARRLEYGFDSMWGTDDIADRVLRFDRQTGNVTATITMAPGAYPTGIAVGGDAIWIANAGTSTLSRVDPGTNTIVVAAIPLRAVPSDVAAGSRDVWVTARTTDALMRIDPQANAVSATLEVCDRPSALAADGETVWLGCTGSHEVWHLDRDGGRLSTTDVGGAPTDIAIQDERIFVTVRGE